MQNYLLPRLFIILILFILSSCVKNPHKQKYPNNFFKTHRLPVYNQKYIDTAKENVQLDDIHEEDDSEKVNIPAINKKMYKEMTKENSDKSSSISSNLAEKKDLSDSYAHLNKYRAPFAKSNDLLPNLHEDKDKIDNFYDNFYDVDIKNLHEEISNLKKLLVETKLSLKE